MRSAPYQEALRAAVNYPDNDLLVTPVSEGLINKTYKVVIKSNNYKLLLQQVNNEVFLEPEKVQANYIAISGLLNLEEFSSLPMPVRVPSPLCCVDGHFLFVDSKGNYWRVFEFVENGMTLHKPATAAQARRVAETFACLTASFEFYPIEKIYTTIPGFHDLSLRYWQFRQALNIQNFDRLDAAASIISELKNRERYVDFYEAIIDSPDFEKRLMHHDAKISNILFREETGNVICPVDMDTCMPGYFFSDIGDMIRSMASSDDEKANSLDQLHIRKDYYESIVEGYLSVLQEQLTDTEKKYIHSAGLLMIYMQALRFLTDFLNADIYYHIDYPGQNLDRAKNQLTLLTRLEEFLLSEYSFKL
ncbi:MAG TPA: phosphotransferase [Flavitalea sp.]|nr:phosphotransferase [Flavitalea sp.]